MTERSTASSTLTRRLFGVSLSDVLRLIIASAVVGVTLRLFGLNPRTLWADFFDAVGEFFASWPRALTAVFESLGPAASYVLYGAIIVVPIWIAFRVINAVFGKR